MHPLLGADRRTVTVLLIRLGFQGHSESWFSALRPYRGEDTIRALKHAKPLRRSHVNGSEAAETGLARVSQVIDSPLQIGRVPQNDGVHC